MSTRCPFVVRLSTPDDSIAVDARDVQFSRTWRGGFKDATVTLNSPLDARSPLLSPFSKLRIEDARTCRTLWEGYIDLPGKSHTSEDGDVWRIGATGPSARLVDRQRPYIAIDTSFEGWKFHYATKTGRMSGETGALPSGAEEGADCLLLSWNNGIAVGNTDRVTMAYNRLRDTEQFVGALRFTARAGFASTVQRTQMITKTDFGAEEIAINEPWVVVLTDSPIRTAGGAFFPVGRNRLKLRIFRDGGSAQNTDSENWWGGVTQMRISALLRDINGDWISGPGTYNNEYLLANEVVIDALYWFCARFVGADIFSAIDIPNASIDASFTHQIDQLAYDDPTTMQEVLEALSLLEPDMVWEVLESNAAGQHRFALRRLHDGLTHAGSAESGPRYLATSVDGWDAPGGEADLRNAVTVAWEDGTGSQKSQSYEADVEALDQWWIRRDAELVDLGPELGSQANADRIGPKVLEQASKPPESGTLTVRRKIRDLWAGCDVDPWEIEPGYPILIQDVDLDPLPITDVDVSDSDASAQLTLSEPVLDDEQLVNLYARRRRRRA